MSSWIRSILKAGPDLHPMVVIATSAGSAVLALFGAILINNGVDTGDVLAFLGSIAGSAFGALLAVSGAVRVERWKSGEAKQVQNRLLKGVLSAIAHTAKNAQAAVNHENPGAALVLLTTAHQVLTSRRTDLATIRQSLPIDNFEVFESLQILDTSLLLADRLCGELTQDFELGNNVQDRSAQRDIVDHVAQAIELQVQAVLHYLDAAPGANTWARQT